MSESQEIAMGKQSDPAIVAQYGLYQNEAMQKFIDEKGQQMAKVSHRPNLDFEFKILDSPVVNAFAVPGGYVYFTRGIMAHFNNEAEFAGVLGHEIGHVTARHSAKQYSKQQVAQVLMVGGMLVSPEFAQFGNEAQQGLGLLFLKFGRDNESESDKLGVEYSTKIGYDAQQMAGFFHTLDRLSQESGAGEIPSFLSTHPHPADRFENVKKMATEQQAKLSGQTFKIERNAYLQMVDGLVYGEDPRQGFVEDNVFYHPELKFQFPYPTGWKLHNSPTQVQMAPENGKALLVFTISSEKNPEAAAKSFAEQYKLTVKESEKTNVNGFPAFSMLAEQKSDQQSLTILSYFIEKDSNIYVFLGLSNTADFSQYGQALANTMIRFDKLTDSRKLNVKPTRIKVEKVPRNMNLSQVFTYFKISESDHNELAVLNGMELNQEVTAGSLIKVFTK
ncbi:MAG: peptidase M48 [Cyclobacteriaceae bacterium]|nr:MAG: peptidase M48 [Cyclobacteriaceae bacterium]